MKWKQYDNKIYECTEFDFDLKIKDVLNSLNKTNKIKFSYIRYIFPINEEISIPTVFSWNLGGKNVSILGNWDDWYRKIPLIRSNNDFTTIIPLFSGEFCYKFLVDGQQRHAKNHKIKSDSKGNLINITNLLKFEKSIKFQNSFCNKKKKKNFGTTNNKNEFFYDFKKDPPVTPPHLANLFKVRLINEVSPNDKLLLDSPLNIHVFLNHLFFFSNKKFILKFKENLPALRARINEKTLNLIFFSTDQNLNIKLSHPLKTIL